MSQAKTVLEKAFTDFNFSMSDLQRELKKLTPNERMLTNKLNKLETSLGELNNAHTAWLSKPNPPTDDEAPTEQLVPTEKYSSKWLEEVWNEYYEIHDDVDEKLATFTAQKEPPAYNNEQKLKICSMEMDTLQKDIKTKTNLLMSHTSAPMQSESHIRYEQMLSEVKDDLNVKFVQLFKSLLSLDSVNMEKLLQDSENFRQAQQTNIVNIQLQLASHSNILVFFDSVSTSASSKRNGDGEMQSSVVHR